SILELSPPATSGHAGQAPGGPAAQGHRPGRPRDAAFVPPLRAPHHARCATAEGDHGRGPRTGRVRMGGPGASGGHGNAGAGELVTTAMTNRRRSEAADEIRHDLENTRRSFATRHRALTRAIRTRHLPTKHGHAVRRRSSDATPEYQRDS